MNWNELYLMLGAPLRGALFLLFGWPVLRFIAGCLRKYLLRHTSAQTGMLGYKFLLYAGTAILLLSAMAEWGFQLKTVYGAAGIAGVAFGFASQTSLSNLISGLFLIWEKPFEVDDVLQVGTTVGVVTGIDLLSTKIRTFDNKLVRIPNESLIKTEVTNITRYPIRRFDLTLGVAYKEDVGRVMQVLKEVADQNPYCLDEPEPVLLFKGFGESSLDFMLGVWFEKSEFVKVRNTLQQEIKERFDAEGIEIPFPHRTLYAGSETPPFPVRIVPEAPQAP